MHTKKNLDSSFRNWSWLCSIVLSNVLSNGWTVVIQIFKEKKENEVEEKKILNAMVGYYYNNKCLQSMAV